MIGRAAEVADVIADPFDGEALIKETDVLRVIGRSGETENVDAEIEGNDDDVLGGSEMLAAVEGRVTRA